MTKARILSCVLLLLVAQAAAALPLWELQQTRGQVVLLGSIHFLRASDYPLPAPMERAYDAAEVIVMELDMDDLDPVEAQALSMELAVDPRGRDLEALMGPRDFAKVRQGVAQVGIPLELVANFEPWFAAMLITQLHLTQLGLDSNLGLEKQWSVRAARDGKEIRGLETLAEQLSALDTLAPGVQRRYLLQTLAEAPEAEAMINDMLDAWRSGDVAGLERVTIDSLREQPEVYRRLLVDRNRAWTQKIAAMARDGGNYLVVVGAAHLLGDDSVLRMLQDAGYPARRIR